MFSIEYNYAITGIHENLMKYQYFWFTSAFLDVSEKFSPSIRGKPEISTQNKTNITNLLGW